MFYILIIYLKNGDSKGFNWRYKWFKIIDYKNNELTGFNSIFRKENLQDYIRQSEKSITSSDIKISLQKRIELSVGEVKKYTINSNFPIKKGDYTHEITSFPEIKVILPFI